VLSFFAAEGAAEAAVPVVGATPVGARVAVAVLLEQASIAIARAGGIATANAARFMKLRLDID